MSARCGAGIVRNNPIPASIMIWAAAMPVMSEICAFHFSIGKDCSYSKTKLPSERTTFWVGMLRLTAPRARS